MSEASQASETKQSPQTDEKNRNIHQRFRQDQLQFVFIRQRKNCHREALRRGFLVLREKLTHVPGALVRSHAPQVSIPFTKHITRTHVQPRSGTGRERQTAFGKATKSCKCKTETQTVRWKRRGREDDQSIHRLVRTKSSSMCFFFHSMEIELFPHIVFLLPIVWLRGLEMAVRKKGQEGKIEQVVRDKGKRNRRKTKTPSTKKVQRDEIVTLFQKGSSRKEP